MAATAVLTLAAPAWAREVCQPMGPATASLEGKLYDFEVFGAPGYGDTPDQDVRTRYLGLVLSPPACVTGRPEWRSLSVVQLVTPPAATAAAGGLLGGKVRVRGRLFPAAAEDHHTEVLMTVRRLQPAKASK